MWYGQHLFRVPKHVKWYVRCLTRGCCPSKYQTKNLLSCGTGCVMERPRPFHVPSGMTTNFGDEVSEGARQSTPRKYFLENGNQKNREKRCNERASTRLLV